MGKKKVNKPNPEKKARREARMNAKKNRNVRKQNLPKFEKNANGTLNRDKPLTWSEAHCTQWRKDNVAKTTNSKSYKETKKKAS